MGCKKKGVLVSWLDVRPQNRYQNVNAVYTSVNKVDDYKGSTILCFWLLSRIVAKIIVVSSNIYSYLLANLPLTISLYRNSLIKLEPGLIQIMPNSRIYSVRIKWGEEDDK